MTWIDDSKNVRKPFEMKRASFAILLFVGAALAHTQMSALTVAGTDRTDCLRGNFDPKAWEGSSIYEGFPLQQIGGTPELPYGMLSENYTCGFMPWSNQPSAAQCNVNPGDTLYLNYYHGGSYTGETKELDNWISHGHLGPIMISMAALPASGSHQGVRWWKIWQKGLLEWAQEGAKAKWASANYLNDHGGKVDFQIPSDLAPGKYLLRTELLALHSAGQKSGAQPYVRCAELNVGGNGKITAAQIENAGYSMVIPSDEYATLDHPGVHLNVWWEPPKVYPYPGGDKVYVAGAVADTTPTNPPAPTPSNPPVIPSTTTTGSTLTPAAPAAGTKPNFSKYTSCVNIFSQGNTFIKYYWTVNGGAVDMAIQSSVPTGYASVGLSTDGSMGSLGQGSDAWFVAKNNDPKDPCYFKNDKGGCIGDLWIPSYNIKLDTTQDVKNVKVGSDNNALWGTFTRKLVTGDTDQDTDISLTQPYRLIFGLSNVTATWNNVPYHSVYGASPAAIKFGEVYRCADEDVIASSATHFVAGVALLVVALLF